MKKRGKAKPHKSGRRHRGNAAGPSAPRTELLRARDSHAATARAVVTAPAYERDEREALALLLLPFLILALSLGLSQTLKPAAQLIEAALPAKPSSVVVPGRIALSPLAMPAAAPGALRAPPSIVVPSNLEMPRTAPAMPAVAIVLPAPDVRIDTPALLLPVTPPVIALAIPQADIRLPSAAPEIPAVAADVVALPLPVPNIELPLTAPSIPVPPVDLALAIPAPAVQVPLAAPPIPLPGSLAESQPSDVTTAFACTPAPRPPQSSQVPAPAEFGAKLAKAAVAQTNEFVIYSARYKKIAYPMGDVPSLYGACSDLVIRAYRAVGIDLQELVQRARIGAGDPNIDHRRTETLRTFFARHGETIAPSSFGEDYQTGDIVTYYRPYSRVSRAHIAIVTGEIGPSGNPMIVHNRGWGPQVEDALFVDRITGHYRFSGAAGLTASVSPLAARPTNRAAAKVPVEAKTPDGPVRQRKASIAAELQ